MLGIQVGGFLMFLVRSMRIESAFHLPLGRWGLRVGGKDDEGDLDSLSHTINEKAPSVNSGPGNKSSSDT